jgi:molybdenum cofactor cytidylyltransferase
MRLIETLPVSAETRIAFVGAGGKSTAVFRLARETAPGFPAVLVTTSTHLGQSQSAWADHHISVDGDPDLSGIDLGKLSGVILVTGPPSRSESGKLTGLTDQQLVLLDQIAVERGIPLLVEADGSRRLPLKAPAPHEPAVPGFVTEVVVCAGLIGVGHPLSARTVHRPEVFAALSGLKPGEIVTPQALVKVLLAEQGGLKGTSGPAARTVLLNQADSATLAAEAGQLSRSLVPAYRQAILAQLQQEGEQEVLASYRKVAGVVLAAGESSRFGSPKQLLDWQGRPFVRAAAETALAAGLDPVVVVTGAHQREVQAVVADLPVLLIHNPEFAEGQGSSVRSGIARLSTSEFENVSAAVFLLSDQPHIPAELVRALGNRYFETLAPVVATMVDGRRGNPVLFDQRTFPLLRSLTGEAGGRQVFSVFSPVYVPWLDYRIALDIDTPEDYDRLRDLMG